MLKGRVLAIGVSGGPLQAAFPSFLKSVAPSGHNVIIFARMQKLASVRMLDFDMRVLFGCIFYSLLFSEVKMYANVKI